MEEELVEDIIVDAVLAGSEMPENVLEATKEVTTEVVNQTKSILHLDQIKEYFTWENFLKVITSVIAILIFYVAYRLIKAAVKKTASKKLEPHTVSIITRAISYVFYILVIMYVLNLFGINLTAIWGAAGIAGVALGFAAQTSVSNLISGVFVVAERAMKIGDYIEVSGVSGTVDTIGLLSVTVHTLDNQMIRIPNSTIINSNLVNYSRYEKRRFVFPLPISYDSDMETALIAAKEIADTCIQNGHILADPEPRAYYDGFNEAVNLRLAVWFERSKLIDTKNAVYTTAVKVFQKYGVVIPFTRYDIKIVPDEQPGSKKAKKSESKPEPPALISKKSEKIEAIAEKPKASVRKSTKKSV
ncbi:MAG: mechanosensitive ion channel family protein [Treponema sp.]|nr:mechanosensitive ion channel family protein [Treponema sp.]